MRDIDRTLRRRSPISDRIFIQSKDRHAKHDKSPTLSERLTPPLDRGMSMRSPSDWALLFLQLSSSVFLLQVHGLPKLLHFNQEMQVIEDPFGLGGLPSARN